MFLAAWLAPAQRYNFRIYGDAEGLTDPNVNSMLQDHAGFLWVATNNGLFQFDGHRFRRYGVESGLPSSEAWTLLETSDGTLWVVTRGGVVRRVRDRFEGVSIGSNRLPFGMNDLAEDKTSAGHGVFLTTKEGLLRLGADGKRDTVAGTEGVPIWSVAGSGASDTPAGHVWYARSDSICHFDGQNSQCYGKAEGVDDSPAGGLVVDHEGTVWARSAKHLMVLPRGAKKFEARDHGLSYSSLRGYASLDSRGMVMIPTETGLARWNGKDWWVLGEADGLIVPSTSWGMQDREGSVWIGMQGGGLARWLGSGEWENWTRQQGLTNEQVWAMARDQYGRLLIASSGGIDALDEGKLTRVNVRPFDVAGNRFRSIAFGRDNSLWAATSDRGLARIDGRTGRLSPDRVTAGLPAKTLFTVFVDEQDTVWVVSTLGVYTGRRQGGGWVWKREPVPQADAEVTLSGMEDRAGRIWVTTTRGVAVRENGRWSRVGAGDGVPERLADGIAEAPDGTVVVAYVDSVDLFRITMTGGRKSVTRIPYAGTEAPTSTYFLGFDRAGRLWRGTGSGVYVLVHDHWIQYTHQDGLVWNGVSLNAFFADTDGSVWIGTANGLSHHLVSPADNAARDEQEVLLPASVIGIQAGGKSLPSLDSPRIDYRAANLLISFASPAFRRDKEIRFRYRLRGQDTEWTETSDWEVHYSGLKPGNYVFEVASGKWNGGWSGAPAELPIVITGPWWSARWLAAAVFGLLVAGAVFLWWLRDRAQARNARELRLAVQQRTAELERERGFEKSRNKILETLLSDQSLGPVLDGIAGLVSEQMPGARCVIIQKNLKGWRVASAPFLPKPWLDALDGPDTIPFEVWQRASEFVGPETHPAWLAYRRKLDGPAPAAIHSVPIGNADSPLGALLLFYPEPTGAEPWQTILEANARVAQIALEHRRFCDELHFQAHHDSLTGLPNRALFEERLASAVGESKVLGRRMALLYIDIDGFKQINDRLSHRAGDTVLEELARRMRVLLRPDDIVARIGGDEFNVLVPDVADAAEASDVAARLIAAIREPLSVEGHELFVTACIGISMFPGDSAEAEELQYQADAAMYYAKSLGKNGIQSFGSGSDSLDRVRMEQALRHALRDGLFVLDYQPKFTAYGHVAGFEALLRLRHPKEGLIPPLRFISIAEETGLIVPIGAWVIDEVCRQIAEWNGLGLGPVSVAVNISGPQIVRSDFAKSVQESLALHQVPSSSLELELTERMIVSGGGEANRQMHALRALGVTVSIDDFGTGLSSLSYLRSRQVDAIKLDRSFVQSIDTDPAARRLVKAVVGVAKGLGLGVIAEGVETEPQRQALVNAGCPVMQGFLFARPQPAASAEQLLRNNRSSGDDLGRIETAIESDLEPITA